MKRNMIAITFFLVISLCACGSDAKTQEQARKDIINKTEKITVENIQTKAAESEIAAKPYSMMFYTNAPNQTSSVKIEYPVFSEDKFNALNALIYTKVENLAQIDTSLFSKEADLNIDYQSAVTLLNSKAVSIIFWGLSSIEGAAYPINNLIAFNIDLASMEEITFEDLYIANTDFTNIFFNKAFFPANPITSYDEASFGEMLKLQSPEYQSVNPFSISGNVSCFLKPDGIVLSMPAAHATGNDHFEAQLKYEDIDEFYLLENKYWE